VLLQVSDDRNLGIELAGQPVLRASLRWLRGCCGVRVGGCRPLPVRRPRLRLLASGSRHR
jgi:hypothetical protein